MTLIPEFVEFMPEEIKPGVLYVSLKYETTIHLCACGCGNKTHVPFGSPEWWQITIEDEKITLHPSIGNWQFPCRSHYWIVKNEVKWC